MSRLLLVSLGRNGGLPKYAAAIAAGLEASGTPALSLCAAGSEHPIPGAWRVPTYRNMVTLLLSSLTVLPLLLLLVALLRLRHGIRVVYFPYVHTWTPVLCLWARLLGARTVVTFHDYRPHLGEAGVLSRFILWLSSRLAQRYVFLSEHVRAEAAADRVAIAAISTVIPHGLFSLPGLLQKTPDTLAPAIGTILFLGRISKYKGVELLLEAYRRSVLCPAVRVVVAGKANYVLDRALLTDSVEFLDRFLDEAEMAELLNRADLLVLPYLEATQSGIVTLGMDSATPMLCTRVEGLSEQLRETEALFAAPSVDALAYALESAAALDVRQRLCQALLDKKADLDWRHIAERVQRFCTS